MGLLIVNRVELADTVLNELMCFNCGVSMGRRSSIELSVLTVNCTLPVVCTLCSLERDEKLLREVRQLTLKNASSRML